MAFVTDKEELKPGLIIFRRGDVDHRRWYCRIKLPRADRYKTFSLKTTDKESARERAYEHDADVRADLRKGYSVFNRPFSKVAEEYAAFQDQRAKNGEITPGRAELIRIVIRCHLNPYVCTTQIHLIAQDRWDGYPAWRRKSGEGVMARSGSTRPLTEEEAAANKAEAEAIAAKHAAEDERAARVGKKVKRKQPKPARNEWVIVSDATIRFEMAIFRGVMNYAIAKRYVTADRKFVSRPDLKVERRDEFTLDEYRALHSKARAWKKAANAGRPSSQWVREVAYNFILIMCNTGMRPPEARNLRWRDITPAKDREGREIVVLWVRGKGKQRKLVAPQVSVGKYLDRIREVTLRLRTHIPIEPDQPVFSTFTGGSADSLYSALIRDLLDKAGLLIGPSGTPRSTYCFLHTYATLRLSEGVDVYFLAEQMGTSVKMIEDHYGHVNTLRHADRVLHGMGAWDSVVDEDEADETAEPEPRKAKKRGKAPATAETNARARQAIKAKQPHLSNPSG